MTFIKEINKPKDPIGGSWYTDFVKKNNEFIFETNNIGIGHRISCNGTNPNCLNVSFVTHECHFQYTIWQNQNKNYNSIYQKLIDSINENNQKLVEDIIYNLLKEDIEKVFDTIYERGKSDQKQSMISGFKKMFDLS